jgi:hypothetical protein
MSLHRQKVKALLFCPNEFGTAFFGIENSCYLVF